MFNVSVTAIVKRCDGRMLITKRAANKIKWPSKWTVPGGKVEAEDFILTKPTINSQWYDVLEQAVNREVFEETGLHILKPTYLCSLAVKDTIIISYVADIDGSGADPDHLVLQVEECDEYAWVNAEEAKNYDLIEGIQDELEEAERL